MNDTTGGSDPIARVHAGMTVLDRNGEGVGTVSAIRLRDRTLLAVASDDGRALSRPVAELFRGTEPKAPRQIAEKLLRTGYRKVDRPRFRDGGVYVPADEISGVDGTIVWLSSSQDSLVPDCTADR
jgi:hypothetical protein